MKTIELYEVRMGISDIAVGFDEKFRFRFTFFIYSDIIFFYKFIGRKF